MRQVGWLLSTLLLLLYPISDADFVGKQALPSLALDPGYRWSLLGNLHGNTAAWAAPETLAIIDLKSDIIDVDHWYVELVKTDDLGSAIGADFPLSNLQLESRVFGMVQWPSGEVATISDRGSVCIFPADEVRSDGRYTVRSDLKVPFGRTEPPSVTAVVTMPDGGLALVSTFDGIFLFDASIREKNDVQPYKVLRPQGYVFCAVLLPNGGLAVGTANFHVDIFDPHALSAPGKSKASQQLKVDEWVVSLAVHKERSWLAVATGRQSVITFDISRLGEGVIEPAWERRLPEGLTTIEFLGWDILAVGLSSQHSILFLDLDDADKAVRFYTKLQRGFVRKLLPLTKDILAAGMSTGDVNLYNLSKAGVGAPVGRFKTGGQVREMVLLQDGSLAVGTTHWYRMMSYVNIFNISGARWGRVIYPSLGLTGHPKCMLRLPGDTFAVGLRQGGVEFFKPAHGDQLVPGYRGLPFGTVPLPGRVVAMDFLTADLIVVGLAHGAVAIIDFRALKVAATLDLESSGIDSFGQVMRPMVHSVAALPRNQLGVGTDQKRVLVYHLEAALADGRPFRQLETSGVALCLHVVADTILVVGTDNTDADVFNLSFESNKPQYHIPTSISIFEMGIVEHAGILMAQDPASLGLWDFSSGRTKPEFVATLPVNGIAHNFVLVPGEEKRLIVGASILQPQKCPPATYASNWTCQPCDEGWTSFQGASQCTVRTGLAILQALLPSLLLCLAGAWLRQMVGKAGAGSWSPFLAETRTRSDAAAVLGSERLVDPSNQAGRAASRDSLRALRRVTRGLALACCVAPSVLVFWEDDGCWECSPSQKAAMLSALVVFIDIVGERPLLRGTSGTSAPSGLCVLLLGVAIFTNLLQLPLVGYADPLFSGACRQVSTPLGDARGEREATIWLSLTSACLALFSSATCSQDASPMKRRRPAAARLPCRPKSLAPLDIVQEECQLFESQAQAQPQHRPQLPEEVDREGVAGQDRAGGQKSRRSSCRSCRCGHMVQQIAVRIQGFRKVATSWHGRHCVMLANALINSAGFAAQFGPSAGTPREPMLLICGTFAVLCLTSSSLALMSSWRWCWSSSTPPLDAHFRHGVLWKASLLVTKTVLLVCPVRAPVDVKRLWSCGPLVLCPDWCKDIGGFCAQVNGSCDCVSPKESTLILLLAIMSNVAVFALTAQDLAKFCWRRFPPLHRSRRTALRAGVALLGAFGVNLAQVLFVVLLSWAPTTCFMLDFEGASALALPVLPLSLLANDAKWVLESWSARPISYAPVRETFGVRIFGVLAFCCSLGGALYLYNRDEGEHRACSPLVRPLLLSTLVLAASSSLMATLLQPRSRLRRVAAGGDGGRGSGGGGGGGGGSPLEAEAEALPSSDSSVLDSFESSEDEAPLGAGSVIEFSSRFSSFSVDASSNASLHPLPVADLASGAAAAVSPPPTAATSATTATGAAADHAAPSGKLPQPGSANDGAQLNQSFVADDATSKRARALEEVARSHALN